MRKIVHLIIFMTFCHTLWGNSDYSFIEKVVLSKDSSYIYYKDSVTYNKYQKLNVGFIGLTQKEEEKILLRYFGSLFENNESYEQNGEKIHFLLTRERLDMMIRQPNSITTFTQAIQNDWVDTILEEKGINTIVNESFADFDMYQSSIPFLMALNFTGPLSSQGLNFYHYQVTDTTLYDGIRCKKINFTPKYNNSLGFIGEICVVDTTNYPMCFYDVEITKERNINFIDRISITSHFSYDVSKSKWLPKDKNIRLELQLFNLFVNQYITFSDYSYQLGRNKLLPPKRTTTEYNGTHYAAYNRSDDYWNNLRPVPINKSEKEAKERFSEYVSDSSGPSAMMVIGQMLINNRIQAGWFDFHPIFSLLSHNDIENYRIRIGGKTNYKLSRNLFFDGYLAYGTGDKKFKFFASGEYSLPKKNKLPTEFPIRSFRLSYGQDYKQVGQLYHQLTNPVASFGNDNLFYSFRFLPLDRMLYVKQAELRYTHEFQSGLSWSLVGSSRREDPIGNWSWDGLNNFKNTHYGYRLRNTEGTAIIRFAPNERVYNRRSSRFYITRLNPEFVFTHSIGINGLFGGEHYYNRTTLSVKQHFNLWQWGTLTTRLHGAKIWNTVPYPLLLFPMNNPSYLLAENTYSLMMPLEYVVDEYMGVDLEHHFQGALLNFIPVNKYFKLREVVGLKAYWGSISEANRTSVPVQYLEQNPSLTAKYAEAYVGIENIFRILRVDFIWRLGNSYLPNTPNFGVRVGGKIQF